MKQLDLDQIKKDLDSGSWFLDPYYPGVEINQVYLGQIDEILEDHYWGDDGWHDEFRGLDEQLKQIDANIEMSPGCHTYIYAHREREINIDNYVDLSFLYSLEQDWDTYGSPPMRPEDIETARYILEKTKDTFFYKVPHICPCGDPSVYLQYDDNLVVDVTATDPDTPDTPICICVDGEAKMYSIEDAIREIRKYVRDY